MVAFAVHWAPANVSRLPIRALWIESFCQNGKHKNKK